MLHCANCGHELGGGRFCTNCGQPADGRAARGPTAPDPEWQSDTAERRRTQQLPALPPTVPPPPPTAPPPPPPPPTTPTSMHSSARYPLFADEVAGSPTVAAPPAPPPLPPPGASPGQASAHVRRRPLVGWVVAAFVLVLVVVLGWWLVAGRDHDDDGSGSTTPETQGTVGKAGDLAPDATVDVPATAPPNQDTAGNRTTYGAANLLDGVPETCWRMPGDGTGQQLTITLPRATTLRSVGLINGYAKSARSQGRELDWYHGNRRVLRVEWGFDDGSTVEQRLKDTTAVQSVDVDVTTTTVTLRLVEVSEPGAGPAARDYTAISDLSIVGAGG